MRYQASIAIHIPVLQVQRVGVDSTITLDVLVLGCSTPVGLSWSQLLFYNPSATELDRYYRFLMYEESKIMVQKYGPDL